MQTKRKGFDSTVWTLSIVASLICINVVGLAYFDRLDWTADKQFTLSSATKKALVALPEPVTIRAYFTADLPPPYGTQTRYVRDLLDAYYAQARGKVRFEFIDPGKQISEEHEGPQESMGRDVFGRTVNKPTAMEQELEAKGIVPVQVRVNASDKVEVKRAFMGMSLSLGDKQEVIPVITETTGLEYDLTTLLRKLARHDTQRLGVLTGHDGVEAKAMSRAMGALSEMYAVSEISFAGAADEDPLEGLDALLVVGPKSALSGKELDAIRSFIATGHAVGLFSGPVQSDLQSLTVTDNTAGLDTLFGELGVEVQPGLVLDAECATLNVQQQAGFMRVAQPVNYPYVGQSTRMDSSHVTSGLDKVMLPFMGPISVRAGGHPDIKSQMWVQSSPKAWVQAPPYDLNPMQRWTPDPAQLHAQGLVVALEGPLILPKGTTDAEAAQKAAQARVVVAAGHDFLLDAYLQKPNEALLLNMADWLMHDDDLLAVRTRGLSTAPLKQVGASTREAIKLGNIVGLPLALVAFGLLRWRRREARRQTAGFIVAQAPRRAA